MKKLFFLLVLLLAVPSYAVELSDNDQGDVIIFPFYTVENDHTTTVNIVNNTDKVKAVKIKFKDRFFDRDVLDFNIYLAPYDEYHFTLDDTISNSSDHLGEQSTIFYREDSSCTPYLSDAYFPNGQPFLPFFMDQVDSQFDRNMDRTQTGTMSVIDMGEVIEPEAQAILFTNGVPNDCPRITDNWYYYYWNGAGTQSMSTIKGGLSASMLISNELSGASSNMNPIVLNNTFIKEIYHTSPGSLDLNFYSGFTDSMIKRNGTSEVYSWDYEVQALASLMQKTEISADFDVTQADSVDVSWVITLLNKSSFVRTGFGYPTTAILPFLNIRNVTDNGACDEFIVEVKDEFGNILNPVLNQDFKLCESVNVVPIREFGQLPTLVIDDTFRSSINVGYLTKGSITLKTLPENQMTGYFQGNQNQAATFYGLPIDGFQLTRLDDGQGNTEYLKQPFSSSREIYSDWIFIDDFE